MKGRVLALGLLLALFAAFLTRGAGPAPARTPQAQPLPAASVPPPQAAVEPPLAEPARDPFRYLEASASRPDPLPHAPEPKAEMSRAPVPVPLRLLGFVRRGDELLAALSIFGVVVTAGAGELAEGYEILAVDEDAGVRLRATDGGEIVLAAPGS